MIVKKFPGLKTKNKCIKRKKWMYGMEWGKKLIYVIEKEWMYGQIKFQFKKNLDTPRTSDYRWTYIIAMEYEFSKRACLLAFQK